METHRSEIVAQQVLLATAFSQASMLFGRRREWRTGIFESNKIVEPARVDQNLAQDGCVDVFLDRFQSIATHFIYRLRL